MPQRTTGTPGATLSGAYTVTGFTGRTLRRDDGVALSINTTKRRNPGPGDAARYVTVSNGPHLTEYGGNLYGPGGLADERATADLDGCQFQHRATGIRYVITATAPGVFTVEPVSR